MSDHVDELLGLYALGGLEPDDLTRVEAHLDECPDCERESDTMRALAAVVAESVLPVEPQREARARVLNGVAAVRSQPRRPPRPAAAPFGLRWAPLALTTLAAAALLGWNVYLDNQVSGLRAQVATQAQMVDTLRHQATQQAQIMEDLRQKTDSQQQIVGMVTSPTTAFYDLASQGQMPAAIGRAYVDKTSRAVVLVVNRLRPLGPDQTYQLWFITPAGAQPSSLFNVNQNGWGMTRIEVPPAVADFQGIGVSVEPAGGSETPTEVVLAGGT